MSTLAAFANLDVDKLITDIASRPAIWDKNFNGRQNKGFLEDTWDELVSFFQLSVSFNSKKYKKESKC